MVSLLHHGNQVLPGEGDGAAGFLPCFAEVLFGKDALDLGGHGLGGAGGGEAVDVFPDRPGGVGALDDEGRDAEDRGLPEDEGRVIKDGGEKEEVRVQVHAREQVPVPDLAGEEGFL